MVSQNKTKSKPKQKLIFDMIAFTFPIDKNNRNSIREKINDPDFYEQYRRRVYPNRSGQRYNNNYDFSIYQGVIIKLSIYPINLSHNFLRVEYNPTHLTKIGRHKFRTFLINLLGGNVMKKIYFHAVVTRLDLTLDVYDMEPGLYIQKSRAIQSSHFRELDGKLSSQVIGSDQSKCRITMYDKNIENQRNNKSTSTTNYQRIEVRLRKLDCTMNELNDSLLKELKRLNFYSKKFFGDAGFSRSFLTNVANEGLNTALNKLSDKNRRRYKRYLEDYRKHPILLEDLNFHKAQQRALGSLIHLEYQQEYLNGVI